MHVVSVSWSGTFVAESLRADPSRELPQQQLQGPLSGSTGQLTVHANELVMGGDGCSTGGLVRRVQVGVFRAGECNLCDLQGREDKRPSLKASVKIHDC